jgi:flagellar hook protein FlgE
LPVIPDVSLGNTTGDFPLLTTTTGAFRADSDGVLKTDPGLVLPGWPATSDGTIPDFPRDSIGGLQPIVINSNQTAGDPTTRLNLGVNLPATGTEAGAAGTPLPLSVDYFGNLGASESLEINFTPTLPGTGSSNESNMVIRNSTSVAEYTLTFGDSRAAGGTPASVAAISGAAHDPATGDLALTVAGGPFTLGIGQLGSRNGLTQLPDGFAPMSITKNGSPVGNLTTVEVDQNGDITATDDTGFTRLLYQIPLVDVPNLNGLLSRSNLIYQISPDSGSFFLWDAALDPRRVCRRLIDVSCAAMVSVSRAA